MRMPSSDAFTIAFARERRGAAGCIGLAHKLGRNRPGRKAFKIG